MTRTEWFPMTIKPTRAGWYEIGLEKLSEPLCYPFHYFDGKAWCDGPEGTPSKRPPRRAYPNQVTLYMGCSLVWRGLAEPPHV